MTNDDPLYPPVPEEPSLLENPVGSAYPLAPPVSDSSHSHPQLPVMNAPEAMQQQHLQHAAMAASEAHQPVFPFHAYYSMYGYNPYPFMAGMGAFPFQMVPQEGQMSPSFYQNFNGMGAAAVTMSPMASPGYQMPMSTWNFPQNATQQNEDKKEKKLLGRKFSPHVESALIERYEMNRFITNPERDQFAKKLGLYPEQVKIWFQNRRYKQKKKDESKVLAALTEMYGGQGPMPPQNPYSPSENEWLENMAPGDPEMY